MELLGMFRLTEMRRIHGIIRYGLGMSRISTGHIQLLPRPMKLTRCSGESPSQLVTLLVKHLENEIPRDRNTRQERRGHPRGTPMDPHHNTRRRTSNSSLSHSFSFWRESV